MRKTYPEAYFNFIDVTALTDSSVVSTTVKEFSNTALYLDNIRQASYGTMELNQFILDGSREIFPYEQPEDVPYWSDEKSDEYGLYAKNPMLEVAFTQAHTSIGLTLYFEEDIPAEIVITWYTLYGTKLIDKTFYPDNKEYFCKCNVQNYGKVTIEFVRSSLPYRYVKMNYVEYGQMWLLGRNLIKSASVYEELDPTSATLSINTAQIEIMDAAGEFELSNHGGLWISLQKEQEIAVTEYVDDNPVNCGTFYLDDWSSQKNRVKFSLIDILGVMDKTKFYGGRIYENEYAGVIISEIMESAGVKKYSVEEEVYYTKLSGWLSIQSHRAALQQVVFACGAVADCSRSDWIKIYKPDRYVSRTIGLNKKFQGTKISLDEYVSAVTVSYSSYVLMEESKQISKSRLLPGITKVEFKKPYLAESITASAGNIVEAATNYVVVSMDTEGECILAGRQYEVVENACTVAVDVIEAGENPKTKPFKGCTLLDAEKARDIAEYLLDYYQLRHEADIRCINAGEAVGNWCNVALMGGAHATTCILSQTLDLSGGNIATMKCRGYSRMVTDYYFAGAEIYIGEDGII